MLATSRHRCSSTGRSHHRGEGQAAAPAGGALITFAKRGDLHARRRCSPSSGTRTWWPTYSPRSGRAIRPVRAATPASPSGSAKGDNAPMADHRAGRVVTVAQEAVGDAEAARGTRFARRQGSDRCDDGGGRGAGAEWPTAAAVAAEAAAAADDVEVEESGLDDGTPTAPSHVPLETARRRRASNQGNDGSKLTLAGRLALQADVPRCGSPARGREAAGFQLPPSQRDPAAESDETGVLISSYDTTSPLSLILGQRLVRAAPGDFL